jgi:hypothetical protein
MKRLPHRVMSMRLLFVPQRGSGHLTYKARRKRKRHEGRDDDLHGLITHRAPSWPARKNRTLIVIK